MAAKKNYYWWMHKGAVAIVEDGHDITINNTNTDLKTITTSGLQIRIQTVALAEPFDEVTVDLTTAHELPIQFHEALIYKVIAQGYMDPRNFDPKAAEWFLMEYERKIKEAKKYARRNQQTGGVIVPRDF